MNDRPVSFDAWETLAEAYSARVETKPHNAPYERPATLSLLPPVAGKRVLDAGCGPGVYARWPIDHGAQVVAFDISPAMLEFASRRLGEQARIVQADLRGPLDFLESDDFDLVLSSLALDYVQEWEAVFREFFRVLRRTGHLVFSVGHPFDDFYRHRDEANYFEVQHLEETWRGFGCEARMPFYRRPLSAMINPLVSAGFVVEQILEPQPLEEFKAKDPKDYEKLMKQPGFICIRALKPLAA